MKNKEDDRSRTAFRSHCLFMEELKHNKITAILGCVFALLFVFAVFLVSHFTYSYAAEKYFTQQAYDTMTEVSEQISQTVNIRVGYWYEQLDLLNRMVSEEVEKGVSADDYDALLERMNAEGYTPFGEVTLLTRDGCVILESGTRYWLGSEPFIQAVLAGRPGENMAGTMDTQNLLYGYDEKLLLAEPIECESTASDAAVAVIVTLEKESVSELLETDIFGDNMSYVVVCDENGNVIVDTSAQKPFGNNLLDTFATFADETTVEELRADLLEGKTNTQELMGTTREFLTYYGPIAGGGGESASSGAYSVKNWRLMILTRADVLTQNISNLFDSSRKLLYCVLGLFSAALIVFVLIYTRRLNRELRVRCLDTLTPLLNDARFEHDATLLLSRPGASYAVVSYNVAHFKLINDRVGHDTGDEVLHTVGNTIFGFLRPFDESAAHSFADRFTVLLRMDTPDEEDRVRVLERELLTAEYPGNLHPRFTIGFYRVPEGSTDIRAAMDRARLAQTATRAKQNTFSNMVVYTPEMSAKLAEEEKLIEMAEGALKNRHFLVYYQLKRGLKENEWAGCEALVRWKDPQLGFIYPSKFIPLFERTGFVVKLDKFVFETVCSDLRTSLDEGKPVVPVSINLSKCHFEENNLLAEYEEIMERYQVPHELIELEVTESMVAQNPDSIRDLIARLHAIGCRCSLDDFGTGYSSLSMVQDFAFDTIKLDRSFFYGYNGFTEDSAIIVETLIQLSHRLRKTVVSEGIEEAEQVDFLRDKNCDMIQGYYFAKPSPVDECRKRLEL